MAWHCTTEHCRYDADSSSDEEGSSSGPVQVALQLLDLMSVLHSRAAGVQTAWEGQTADLWEVRLRLHSVRLQCSGLPRSCGVRCCRGWPDCAATPDPRSAPRPSPSSSGVSSCPTCRWVDRPVLHCAALG